ncbi:MAG TPA: hypothetical protein VLA29_08000 [Acidimicrobiia bacterium]|nr:hypothetical protein [Acidimicrobiia bacterium]
MSETGIDPATTDPATKIRRSRLVDIAPLVPLALVGLLAARPVGDNSFIWHIRAGEAQIDVGRVLTEDVFSFTLLGEGWRTQSWLAELGYAVAESALGGLAWANWMILITGTAILGFVGIAVYRSIRSLMVMSLVLVIAVWLLGPFLQPRPVILSYLLLAMLVVTLQARPRLDWGVVPIIWIWSAVHGSWVLGIGLVVLEAFRTRDRRLFTVGAIAGVATLVTAHGFGTWQIVLDFFESREALSMMQEWMPPAPQDIVQLPYLLIVAGIVVGGIRDRISVRDLVVLLPFLLFGLSSRRAVFPATIVLLPWAAMCLPIPRRKSASVPRSLVLGTGALLGLVAVLPMFVNPLGVLDETRFPSPELVESLEGERLFHSIATGGYLIYADWPGRQVYIDDRAELYGAGFFTEYRAVIAGRHAEAFTRWGVTGVVAEPSWPLVEVLINEGWLVRAEDEHFVALALR